jgi:hypothetical protein
MNPNTTLEAHDTRMSHNELLLRLNRQDMVASIKADQEHFSLRALMVGLYGEGRVLEVEQEIICNIDGLKDQRQEGSSK